MANVPPGGFRLKLRVYDEDPVDHDDCLGGVTIMRASCNKNWEGIKDEGFKLMKRMASKRATLVHGCSAIFSRGQHSTAQLFASIEVLGKTQGEGGRACTIGPQYWSIHFSPMIGRVVRTKDPGNPSGNDGNTTQRYKCVFFHLFSSSYPKVSRN